jgi:threonine/homoserine/homoserine lactone efflux protein
MNFTDPAAIFVSSFIIALSGAMMPGPLLAVTIRDTTRRGFVAAPLLVLGHGILELGLVALLLLGLAEWLKGDAAATFIALGGCGALLWMAAGMVREVRALRFDPAVGPAGAP